MSKFDNNFFFIFLNNIFYFIHNNNIRLILVELRNIWGYLYILFPALNISSKDKFMLNILGIYLSATWVYCVYIIYAIYSMLRVYLYSLVIFFSPYGMNKVVTGIFIFKRLINIFDPMVYLYSNIY